MIEYKDNSFFLLLNCPEEPKNYLPAEELNPPSPYGYDELRRYNEALKSCERIQIDNPEVLPLIQDEDTNTWYTKTSSNPLKPGDLFPIPEGIEWEIETRCGHLCRDGRDCANHEIEGCVWVKLAILKLKSQPDWKEREAMQEMMRGREPRNVIEKIMLEVKGESQERILCAAIWYDDGNTYMFQPVNIKSGIVVSGLRHPHCKTILRSWLYPNWQTDSLQDQLKIEINSKEVQGFITSSQRFVDRKEAAKIFVSGGNKLKYSTNDLYSEDLY